MTDVQPLTPIKKDRLASYLAPQWRIFGEAAHLKRHELDIIDLDNRDVHEKCYRVLLLIEEQSLTAIGVKHYISILEKIKRFDIIREVFSDSIEYQTYNFRDNQFKKEKLLCELEVCHISHISMLLDPERPIIANWKILAGTFTDGTPAFNDYIKSLNQHYAGGGSSTLKLFEHLSQRLPDLTVKQFKAVAVQFNRNDVKYYIESNYIDESQLLSELDVQHRNSLSSKLDQQYPGVNNWKSFASHFNFDLHEINNMATAVKQGNSYSPTAALFEYLMARYPELTLDTLAGKCEFVQRNDVAKYIREKAMYAPV